ncbi:MAG TPA: PIG-L family deacetylase [Bryobacteraceae bacterium]|nr:PIG-L family deacetylase [Bryobacteraceae bacterium]
MKRASAFTIVVLALWSAASALAQPSQPNLIIELERLANTGSVLMIAAHPDDEHTALLAYLAQGRKLRTGYLSLTRGEGGQNVIGPEKGALLGAIRTQELLAARRIDGAEQFFTTAVDFGFSKTAEESLQKWDRSRVVGDIVRVLREFQPDVVLLRFSGTPADGHGQHQASNILGREAIEAAKDPARYPEQGLKPWSVMRVFTMPRGAGAFTVDTGAYNPLLGYSYTELAGISRSQHESQAMGAAQNVGAARTSLQPVGEAPSSGDFIDGIPTGPARLAPQFAALLTKAIGAFDPRRPHEVIPTLLQARRALRSLESDLAARKIRELDEMVARCAGMILEAAVQRPHAVAGGTVPLRIQAINRSPVAIRLDGVDVPGLPAIPAADLPENSLVRKQVDWRVQTPVPTARFRLLVGGEALEIARPLVYRYVDDVLGDRTQPFAVTPPVSVSFSESAILFPSVAAREVPVRVQAYSDAVEGTVALQLPAGWPAQPAQRFRIDKNGGAVTLRFRVTPPHRFTAPNIRAVATVHGVAVDQSVVIVRYPHIPTQTVLQPAVARFTRADVKVLARSVGYIPGAGDEVPAALRQIGCEVKIITADELASGSLAGYDAIVTGVRAFNVREDLRANVERLNEYVRKGGTLVVQYNTADDVLGQLGPYRFKVGRGRVAVEEAPVRIVDASSPVLRGPNAISAADFEGWVQERGLYFPSEWDSKLQSVIASNDPGEKELAGGILYAKHGEGAYIYTSYSWFRQLPAGVPGAFRIFANLLSQ